jgi:endoglucanase
MRAYHLRFGLYWLLVFLIAAALVKGQNFTHDSPTAFARAQGLKRGVNLSGWFSQSPNGYSSFHASTYIDDGDLALITRLGFDNVRLSIDPVQLEGSSRDEPGLNADFTAALDRAVNMILAHRLAVLIDFHPPDNQYKLPLRDGDAAVDHFVGLWRRVAAHYAPRDSERIYFEILNEPGAIEPHKWAEIELRVTTAIREVAPKNTIIATGPNGSSIADLMTQVPLNDDNVIYNFHFYQPHEFTHQGASWAVPWWRYTHGIPYPPTAESMADSLKEVPDAAGRYALEEYWLDGWNARRIQMLMDEAAAWGEANHVPLICDEFGVFRNHMDAGSADSWLRDVRVALEKDGIGWNVWAYLAGFGIATKETGRPAEPRLSTMEALGLTK